jgi:predicted transcriptional regulator
MKLDVRERIILSQILPKEGSFTNLKLIRVMQEELSFSEAENKILDFKQAEDRLTWSEDTVEQKDIKFGEVIEKLIVSKLTELDKEEKLTNEHFSLCEKFMEN